jgi:hypothetical protein
VTTADRFAAWLVAHPELWASFCSVCDEAYASGRTRWSADAALHIVRWSTGADIDNRFSPFAARAYLAARPGRAGFFELRASVADAGRSPQMDLGL